jgi:hypothetical protein
LVFHKDKKKEKTIKYNYPAIYLYVYATIFPQFDFRLILFLDMVSCITLIIEAVIKAVKQHRQTPMYAILIFFGAIFVVLAYLYNIAPLLMSNKKVNNMEREEICLWPRKREICNMNFPYY